MLRFPLILAPLLLAACSNEPQPSPGSGNRSGATTVPDVATINHGPDVGPGEVDTMIRSMGAERTVQNLNQRRSEVEPSRFDSVLNGVATGTPEWLALVPPLLPALKDETRIALTIALAQALRHNAAGVLALVSPTLPADQVCRLSLIEPTEQEAQAQREALGEAIRAVDDAKLASVKNRCLALLRA